MFKVLEDFADKTKRQNETNSTRASHVVTHRTTDQAR
jgi:hypothetical protein